MTRAIELAEKRELSFMRQVGYFDPSKNPYSQVTIVGNGGIGSPVAIALSKLGISKLTLIDADIVNPHNVPNQYFSLDDVGKSKAQALADMCTRFGASEVNVIEEMVTEEKFPGPNPTGIVVSGLDSMEAREIVWKHLKFNPSVNLYLDGRLGGETIAIYIVKPCDVDDIKYYEERGLRFNDEQAIELPCGFQSIIDVPLLIASLITRTIRRHLTGAEVEKTIVFNQDTLQLTKG